MGLPSERQKADSQTNVCPSSITTVSEKPRILIVCDDDVLTERLSTFFRRAGIALECVGSMTAGCACARSGRFQVVFTVPVLADGSWRRLAEIASQYDLSFVVVLVASNFDFNDYAQALHDGAFDVLDALHELPKAAQAAKAGFWAAYLKGAGHSPDVARHPMAA
jgi:DNA-binding NtrC family response regulator